MTRRVTVLCAAAFGVITAAVAVAPLAAQRTSAKAITALAPVLIGGWSGTATVPLPDSVIVVPVLYTFTQSGTTIGGQAMVPGQGTGPISNVVRTGKQVRFRVTAPEGRLLEHDGKFGADGSLEGMVTMDNQPIAKFRITPRKDAKPLPKKES